MKTIKRFIGVLCALAFCWGMAALIGQDFAQAQTNKIPPQRICIGVLPAMMDTYGSLRSMASANFPATKVAAAVDIYRPLKAIPVPRSEAGGLFFADGNDLKAKMSRLGLDFLVKWGVTQQEYDERATVFVILVNRTSVDEATTVTIMVDAEKVPEQYCQLVTRLVGQGLGYIY